ncbi:E3 ubiquitin-protein ligase [Oopsacas minuta]|uniref:RBR-type E3 ubiquitin transferase n=1 Tax=Oopsacas minuta TaxID=111878 RepID=A0AAV7JKN6_9METZ|nr:E3 ubiquitin-protein ligase [Oopsacas minuta]
MGLPCCSGKVCDYCLTLHINTQLRDGNHMIKCPCHRCDNRLSDETMRRVMTESMGERQYLLEVNANKDPTVKLCPKCNLVTTKTKMELFKMKRSKGNKNNSEIYCMTVCIRCNHEWCFLCYAPWHHGMSCKEAKSEAQDFVRFWSKKQTTNRGQRNAYPCPYCGIYIERNGGCPSMECTRCRTKWCYLCGQQKYLFIPLFGHHDDPFSVLGCTQGVHLFDGDYEVTRRVRRGIFVTQVVLIVLITVPFLLLTLPILPIILLIGSTVLVSVCVHKLLNKMKTSWNMEEY